MPKDYNYRALISHPIPWRAATVRTPQLEECKVSFLSNLMRTAVFAMLPTEIAFQLSRDIVFAANAVFRTTGESKTPIDLINTELTAKIGAEFEKQVQEHEMLTKGESELQRWQMGVRYAESMLALNFGMQKSMDALFESIVLGSWTAFETLAGDAWVILVNNCSSEIANTVSEAKKPKDEEKDYKSPYDIRTSLGDYLRDVRAYSFQKLRTIKEAYEVPLGKQKSKEIFNTYDRKIALLSAVRNAFTHSGGKIDKRFIEQVAIFPEWRVVERGQTLSLNGEFVAQLRDAAALTGIAILNAIDDVLTPFIPATHDYLFSAQPAPVCVPTLS